ncbi:MAG: hypothetical protein AB1898_11315 [Acidobacteriota bacterium]
MKLKGTAIGLMILAVVALGFSYLGWRLSIPETCQACRRPLHSTTKTVGFADDKKKLFCCPTCALTAHRQTGKAVDITELSNYETGSSLKPEDAYIVEGSRLNLCIQQHVHLDHDKQASPANFDRCSPSMFAFAKRDGAEKFQREHGGNVMHFRALEALYRQ